MNLNTTYKLYKLRYKRWRSETKSVEWHELTAKIRAYEGDHFAAWVHMKFAALKRAIQSLAEMVEPALQSFNESMQTLVKVANGLEGGGVSVE